MNSTKPLMMYISMHTKNMNLPMPIYGHHVEDITLYLDAEHQERLAALKAMVEESKAHQLTGFIGGPPCPDFSVA